MKKNRNLNKKNKFLFYLIALGLILFLGNLIGNALLEKKVKKIINQKFTEKQDALYSINFDQFDLNIIAGNATIGNLKILPTDFAHESQRSYGNKGLMEMQLRQLEINGLKPVKLLRTKQAYISYLRISDLDIRYFMGNDSTQTEKQITTKLAPFPESFESAFIRSLFIENATVNVYLDDTLCNPQAQFDSLNINADAIHLDSSTVNNILPVTFTNFGISTGNFAIRSMKNYELAGLNMRFNYSDSILNIKEFQLRPKLSREEFNRNIRYNNDWFNIAVSELIFKGLNPEKVNTNETLDFQSFSIVEPDIEIYRDKRLPDSPDNYSPLLASLIKKMPVDINIDTLTVKRGLLKYEEQIEGEEKAGLVYFDPFFINVNNLTNKEQLLKQNPLMPINFEGKIMGQVSLNIHLNIDLTSTTDNFTVSGNLDPLSGTIINPIFENLSPASVVSGDVLKTEFTITANNDEARGQLLFDYTGLDIEINRLKNQHKRSVFMSLLANGVIKKENISDTPKYRVGEIYFERRKDKGIVNFIWNSVKTGLISVVAPIAEKKKKQEIKDSGIRKNTG